MSEQQMISKLRELNLEFLIDRLDDEEFVKQVLRDSGHAELIDYYSSNLQFNDDNDSPFPELRTIYISLVDLIEIKSCGNCLSVLYWEKKEQVTLTNLIHSTVENINGIPHLKLDIDVNL